MLSLLMFQPDYIAKVIDLGEADARARRAEIDAFMQQQPQTRLPGPTVREKLARCLVRFRRRLEGS